MNYSQSVRAFHKTLGPDPGFLFILVKVPVLRSVKKA